MAKVYGYFLKVTQQAPSIEGAGSKILPRILLLLNLKIPTGSWCETRTHRPTEIY